MLKDISLNEHFGCIMPVYPRPAVIYELCLLLRNPVSRDPIDIRKDPASSSLSVARALTFDQSTHDLMQRMPTITVRYGDINVYKG